MVTYGVCSAVITALAIPLQFIDLMVGIIYPVKEATLILIGSKLLGAFLTFWVANHLISDEQRRNYSGSKYIRGLSELVKKEPLKYGLLIRFASIPIVIRNYGLAVLPINLTKYMACVFIQASITSPF